MIWACEGYFCQMHYQRASKARKVQSFYECSAILEDSCRYFPIWFHFEVTLCVMRIYDIVYHMCSIEFPWQKLLWSIFDDECLSLQNSHCFLPLATCFSIIPALWWQLTWLAPAKVTIVDFVTLKGQNYSCMELRSWQNQRALGTNLPFMLGWVQ